MVKLPRLIILPLVFILLSNSILAQEKETKEEKNRLKFIGVEAGMTFFDSEIPDYDFIRGDITYFGSGSVSNSLEAYFQRWYAGIKTEFRSIDGKFGLFSGIRYSKTYSSLGKSSYSESSSDYFYLLHNQEGISTEFLRVKEVNQVSEYIGIPLELRFMPFTPRLFNLFFKVGAEFNYLLSSKFDVVFYDQTFENYQDDVLDKFGESGSYYSTIYAAVGWLININDDLQINVEANIPSLMANDYSTGLINPLIGGGFQINIQKSF